ncbi:ABC-F family ATP-binding cassette domain-containing protein [Paludibacter jiangxiensis]|uniref:ATP-binding cassette, subfamily F n=1 Tax=Paludibacter jiangxiensis TaxID=681398 RepID=A0A170YX17_9BACT|nr:ABC-F family ATP-binding cassette domain-containing protein [Paludibacter jiangxiensis]GAT62148.1 ATP-binding cassette, subfamily F [Paludibacter jiangxiensis]
MASCLQVENLTKSFGDNLLFENISFGIADSQRVALIAKNGAGKTTLLSILAGDEDYESGTISFRRDLRVGYLRQDPAFAPELSVLEACFSAHNEVTEAIKEYELLTRHLEANPASVDHEVYQHALARMDDLKAWDYETRIKQILGNLKITDFDQKIGHLSGGQLKRVALANVLIAEPDLLILDEPTNHLDLEMVEWLESFLKGSKMALLMVTHDRYFLDRVCSDILEIDQASMFHYKGNYSYYLEKRQDRIDNFNAETERTKNLYKKELDWMRRQPQARATKARSRVEAFAEIERRAKQRREENSVSLEVKASYLGSKIFEAKYISKAYGDKVLVDNFYYNFSRYEKMGIVGKNGTGKSTFLKMLLGEVKPDSGSFDVGETVSFGYYSQDGLKFDDQMKVIDVVREFAEEIALGNGRKLSASQFLQLFLFPPEVQHSFVAKLSGGERRRLYLCTVLIKNPNFLVLDEPTNDLDIATLNVLEEYLRGFKGCVIVVSHDRYFMDKVVDHLLAFEGDGKIKDYPGNYTDYREWKELQLAQEAEEKEKAPKPEKEKQQRPKADKPQKLSYKEQKEFEALETEIESLEAEKKQIEEQLSIGTLATDQIINFSNRISEIISLLDEKTMRWLELSELA